MFFSLENHINFFCSAAAVTACVCYVFSDDETRITNTMRRVRAILVWVRCFNLWLYSALERDMCLICSVSLKKNFIQSHLTDAYRSLNNRNRFAVINGLLPVDCFRPGKHFNWAQYWSDVVWNRFLFRNNNETASTRHFD